MNKAILALTLLCGFLLGVVTGPWIWPQHLLSPAIAPIADPAPAIAQVEPTPAPSEPQVEAQMAQAPAESEMQLKGVFVAGDGSRSVALIKVGDWQPQPYRVDQKLPNGYVVKSIDRYSVEVEKDGQNVTLPLIRASSETEPETPVTESAPTTTDTELAEPVAAEPAVASEATVTAPESEN